MTPEEELILFCKHWDDAMVRNNAEEIGKFMSDDWVIVGTEGGITLKDEFLEGIRSGDLTHSRMDLDEMRVNLYGNTGIVVARGTSAGSYQNQVFELYEWATSVFIRNHKKWICVVTMLTPARK